MKILIEVSLLPAFVFSLGSVGTLECGENLFLAEIGVSVGLVLFAGKLI